MLSALCLSTLLSATDPAAAEPPAQPAAEATAAAPAGAPSGAAAEAPAEPQDVDPEAVKAIRDFAEEVYRHNVQHRVKHIQERHEREHEHGGPRLYPLGLEPTVEETRPAAKSDEWLTLTASPVIIARDTLFRVGAEYSVLKRLSLGLWLGTGAWEARKKAIVAVRSIEIAGQFRFYPLGNFRRGLHVGFEMQYLHVNGGAPTGAYVEDTPNLGPLVGVKWTTDAGLAAEAQLGFVFPYFRVLAADEEDEAHGADVPVMPLLNLSLGWAVSS